MANTQSSPSAQRLGLEQLRRRCNPDTFGFETTAELAPPPELIGQRRAADVLGFGLAMNDGGFNVYVAGAPGTGKMAAVRAFLEHAAAQRPRPDDWCYVHKFGNPDSPRALRLPAGRARRLRGDLREVVRAARREIPRAFESEEYIARREAVVNGLNRRREQLFAALAARGQAAGFVVQPTPVGIALIPVMGNRQLSDEEVASLTSEIRQLIDRNREAMDVEIRTFLKDVRTAEREAREQLETQDREVALHAVGGLVEDLVEAYADQPAVVTYLREIKEGILADIALFRSHPLPSDAELPEPEGDGSAEHLLHERQFRKYEINVVVDNADTPGAPVVFEPNPTHPNLIGRIEREALFGALMTDFTLISPGALHRANGGYLVLRVEDLLRAPMSYDALKRSLREGAIAIEDMGEALGLTSARGLRPDPIPLSIKVLLVGEPLHYQLLHALDADFRELFKIRADFDIDMDRTPETERDYAAFAAAQSAPNGRPLDRGGVARLVEESSRMAGDQRKLSACFGDIADLLREANHWAAQDKAACIGAAHVRRAVEQRIYRSALVAERLREMMARGTLVVRPHGEAVGQVHGLSVVGVGGTAFGHPTRITATVGAGREGVLDIERQVELSGPIHSKGVLILSGYLTDTYARNKPLALSARLVFEQSYSEVEGDSASLAELVALLSRLAGVPLRQGIAITGSVNQRGEVQAIGGVNEKIEGFFDACRVIGPLIDQGVIIPLANVENLMLRDDVLAAVEAGQFNVYAVGTVDEALEVLSGQPAAPPPPAGAGELAGIHALVDRRLRELAEALREFGGPAPSPNGKPPRPRAKAPGPVSPG